MPPKKKDAPSKKNELKKKDKVIEDKTFGLKNKKGAKQQKYIQTVTTQVKGGSVKSSRTALDPALERQKLKDEKKKQQEELNLLFKPVQTIGKGADPKSVLCAFFKQGQCSKGDKCKFSHDLNVERKGAKRNIYEEGGELEDTMDDWDEAKLEEVVNTKHGEHNKIKTEIICKYFLDAVENYKYGWFWDCPNGKDKCIYRHALPSGFQLKRDQKKDNKEEKISIEELIEKERSALGAYVTKVTLETFLLWKEQKRKEKMDESDESQKLKKNDFIAGKTSGISGREMFEFNPALVGLDDDEAEEAVVTYEKDESQYDGPVRDITLAAMTLAAREVDDTGTVSRTRERLGNPTSINDESGKLDQAQALPNNINVQLEVDAAIAVAMAATTNGDLADEIDIDEGLFDGEDLDQIEEDLETLDLGD